jgi:hypothetical protein
MSRQDRCDEYAKPKGPRPHGGTDQANLDHWADRAAKNSQVAPRAGDGPMKLPSTKMNTRDTDMKPKVSRSIDARIKATSDTNHDGDTSYLPSVRRNA